MIPSPRKKQIRPEDTFHNVEHVKRVTRCPVCLRYYRKVVHVCQTPEQERVVSRELRNV